MSNYTNSAAPILLLLLLVRLVQGGGENPAFGSSGAGFSAGHFQDPPRQLQAPVLPRAADLARDFHRMVEVMGKVDSLGRLAANPPKLPPISDISELANLSNLGNLSSLSELSKLSEPDALINTSALPDMNSLMEMFAPIINSLKAGE